MKTRLACRRVALKTGISLLSGAEHGTVRAAMIQLPWAWVVPAPSQPAAWQALRWTLVALVAVWLVKSWYLPWLKVWIALRPLPGPWDWIPFWYLASVIWARRKELTKDKVTAVIFSSALQACKDYGGKTARGYIFTTPIIGIQTPEAAQALLTGKVTSEKPLLYRFLKPFLGEKNIVTAGGDVWKTKRRLFSQAFQASAMDGYLGLMRDSADSLVARIEKLLRELPAEPVVCINTIQKCTLDVMGRFALGVDIGVQKEANENYGSYFEMLTALIAARIFSPWNWLDIIYNLTPNGKLFRKILRKMEDIVQVVVINRKNVLQRAHHTGVERGEFLQSSNGRSSVFLDNLLLAHMRKPSYTLDEVRKDADFMMFAGGDSSACAISWTLYLLGLHPEKQRRVQQELEDVLGHGADRVYTIEDLKRLQYMECCIKETLRMFPPFPFVGKRLDQDLVIDGVTVPRGVSCFINIFTLHRNATQFENPEDYVPERFSSEENSRHRHPYSYIPFSAGPKNCLGQKFVMMEVKLVLAKILSKFTVVSTRPLEEVEITFEIVLKAKGGLPVWFCRRDWS